MIISCPACNTRYLVPDSAIGVTGRQVRCASCRHSWFEEATATLPLSGGFVAPPPPPAPPPMPVQSEVVRSFTDDSLQAPHDPFAHEPPFRPRRNRLKILTYAAAGFAVLAMVALGGLIAFGPGGIAGRFGFGASNVPLTIQVTRKPERRTMASGNELLAVTGRILNPTGEIQKVPDIRAELRDAQGRSVYGWTITRPVKQLAPGASADFDSAAVDVPRGSRALNLSFADATPD